MSEAAVGMEKTGVSAADPHARHLVIFFTKRPALLQDHQNAEKISQDSVNRA